jgi:uncharacterized membrane protein YccC
MAVGRRIGRVLIENFWPWFRDNVWPLIRAEVVALVKHLVRDVRQTVERWLSRQSRRQEEARAGIERADKAARQAEAAGDAAEANTQRRLAEVWRGVADSLREENEALRRELEDLVSRADAVVSKVERGVNLRPTADYPALDFAGRELPLLPPSTPLRCSKCGSDLLHEQ